MATAKHQPPATLKAKASGGKIEDLVLSSGDIVIVGAGGEAHAISAKMAGGISDPKRRGIYVGTDIRRDSKTGHLVIGSINKKGYLPINDEVIIVGSKGAGKTSLAGQVGIMNEANKEHILFAHAVSVDPDTGHFITEPRAQRHPIKRDELRFYGGSAPMELRFRGGEDPSLEEGDIEKGYAFYTPILNVPHHQKPYRLTWNVGERASGTETRSEHWVGASTELPMIVSGTGEEVAHVLDRTRDARVVAVRIENADEEQAAAAQRVFCRVAEFLPQLIETRQQEAFKKIIESFMPSVSPSAAVRAQIQMLVAARASILQSGDFISPKEVTQLANYSASNPSVYPNKWKQSGKIFAIQSEGNDYFPFYALNPQNRYQPRPQIAEVLRVFGNTRDSWAIALWFASLNSFLDDERPQDVLATDPDRVVEAAKDESAGIQHG